MTMRVAVRRSSSLLTGLVSYWKLDESSGTRYDAVGSNDLTPTGTVGGATGKLGNGAEMLLADQSYLSCASPSGLSIDGSYTVAWWTYINTLGEILTYRGHLDYYSATPAGGPDWDRRGFMAKAAYNNVMAWFVGFGVSTSPAAPIAHAPFSLGQWNHFIAWADNDNHLLDIVCNNGSSNAIPVTGGDIAGPSEIALEVGSSTATDYADEIIDEIGFWNRLLTSDEKAALYNSGAGITYPFVGT